MNILAIICGIAITAEVSYMIYGGIKQLKETNEN